MDQPYMKLNPLTPEEERVIAHKGTEPPFSGAYENFWEEGMYVCRRCKTPLYKSESKFDAKCGWPSFDDEIPGAVKHTPDPDGLRTEIMCAACGAHLGHVFKGEAFTPKNVRHCVNSISLRFIPKKEVAVFGGGCFWCVEAIFTRLKGMISTETGYAGGRTKNPSYEEVSSGRTGHAEAVRIEYDPKIIAYEDMLTVFFFAHDPTSLNRQGNDAGEQYRSVIFYVNEEQKRSAQEFMAELERQKAYNKPIVTDLKPLADFYRAEEYHQKYFEKNPKKAYCQAIIAPKVAHLTERFNTLLK